MRRDHLRIAITGLHDGFEKVVPVLQVQCTGLRLLENIELGDAPLFTEFFRFQILTPKNGIDVLQPGPFEPQSDGDDTICFGG